MIVGFENGVDRLVTFGDPWHGLIRGGALNLPGGKTMAIPGSQPFGGDCYLVNKPGQPSVITTQAEADQGMQWLNYGLMAGRNHCIFGRVLGENRWIYIDNAGTPWLVTLTFNVSVATGAVTFKRFGVFPDPGFGIEQTFNFAMAGPFGGSQWQIDDINSTGAGILVVTHEPNDFWPSTSGMVTPGYRDVGGAFELSISGIPPAAIVSATQLANVSQAAGSPIDTRQISSTVIGTLTIHVSNVGRHGHQGKLVGYCYDAGSAVPVTRSFWTDQTSYSSPSAVQDTTFIDYTVNGSANHTYQIAIGSAVISLSATETWSGSGRVDTQYDPPSNVSGHKTFTSVLSGFGGFNFSFDGDTPVSYQANDGLLFSDAGDTDNYVIPTSGGDGSTVAIWPKRLANGLYGLCRSVFNFNTYVFSETLLTGVLSPIGQISADYSSTDDGASGRGSRHPVSGEISIEFDASNTALCYR